MGGQGMLYVRIIKVFRSYLLSGHNIQSDNNEIETAVVKNRINSYH